MVVPVARIKSHIDSAIQVAINRVTKRSDELFTSEIASTENGTASPFQKLILPEAKIFSSFERSFSASLGKAFDYISADIARATYGNGEHDYSVTGSIAPETLGEIESIVTKYKQRVGASPDTKAEMNSLAEIIDKSPAILTRKVKNDVFFVDHEGFENYIEIKTPMPNYDQCASMKTRILTVKALRFQNRDRVRALAVFPHNPNGLEGKYAWPPLRYFLDPSEDWAARGTKMMGPGYWNFVGNSSETYEELLECFYEVSVDRRSQLLSLLNLTVGA